MSPALTYEDLNFKSEHLRFHMWSGRVHNTGVTSRNGELSLAGLYAMGIAPQAVTPSLGITAAVQLPREAGGPRTRDLVHLIGPIPDLLEEAMTWVLRNTRTAMGYDERGHGVDQAELPMRAVREVVANALVHRNLDAITDSKRVEIRLLHDRLVITSSGRPVGCFRKPARSTGREKRGEPGSLRHLQVRSTSGRQPGDRRRGRRYP